MGKRKERRLNAKSAANRRVKLDLLPEPSGDFGDSSNQEDVGVGGNGKNHAGSPNSPSSSDNPFRLLDGCGIGNSIGLLSPFNFATLFL
ncbi:hypothetical protein HanHA300_Chr11g0394991 [Helianthus annuus]|nr:hypothetical protein HanHA300_Chr11g0394991 [Helianthus annuus]KAJ0516830.1 hypothetical protein HanHA89_Chr11g0418191 [Helianthus annuus]KAJ0684835.1 hypothetical protein HanLR1_Chr11g0395621 [Helianthus annuus]KAJ0688762.1 hypothetical protein HanOQP8_Chr11g0397861 [Helianthus annuus]